MNFASESGTFSMVVGLPINNQEHFVLEYNSTNLTLDVVAGQSSNPSVPAGTGGGFASEPFIAQTESGGYLQFADNHGSPATVPEPSSILMFGFGFAGLVGLLRRRG